MQNNQNNNVNNKQDIPVREILVKNLPNSTTESNLYKEYFIFGEISIIELKNGNDNKKYSFIKYRLIASAMKACEEMKNKNFNGSIIKVNFSNINQRKDIKGDEENYELNENNCKLIITTLNNNCLPPNEDIFLKIFEDFGKIKGHATKPNNQNNYCIYIEYYKPEDAKRAVEELNNDNNAENRKLLGDENCDIDFYFKSKSYDFKFNPFTHYSNYNMNNMNIIQNMNNSYQNKMISNMFMGMGFGMNNSPQFSLLMQKNLNNQFNLNTNNLNNYQNQKPNFDYNLNIQNQEKTIDNNIPNNNLSNKQIINNQLNNLNMNYQFNNSFKNQMMAFNFMNTQMHPGMPTMNYPQQTQEAIPNNYQIQSQYTNLMANPNLISLLNNLKNQNNNISNNLSCLNNNDNNNLNNNINNNDGKEMKDLLKKIMDDKNNQNNSRGVNKNNSSDSDISSLNGSQSVEEMDFEKEYSLEEENLQYIWNGFLTKNNKDRVNVDLYRIRGKIDDN